MGRIRARSERRNLAAFQSPVSWIILASLLTLTLLWRIYFTWVVSTAGCAETLGLFLGGLHHGPSVIELFLLAYGAAAALWFVNFVRYRPVRQRVLLRGVEALLLVLGLYSVVAWENMLHPGLTESRAIRVIETQVLQRTPFFFVEELALEEIRDEPVNREGRTWWDDLPSAAPRVDDADFPLGLFGGGAVSRCSCLNAREEWARTDHFYVDWHERHGFLTEVEAKEQRDRLPPRPVAPDWCPAALGLAGVTQ